MKNKKLKIGLLVLVVIVFLSMGWFMQKNTLSAVNCEGEKVSIVMYDKKYYIYNFPFSLEVFCGEVIVNKNKLLYVSKYKNGYLNGERKVFYENGQLKLLAFFKNGRLNGKLVGFYKNAQKAIEVSYRDDLENGQKTEWYKNGSPKSIGFYKAGKKDGVFEIWYNKGKVLKKDWKLNASPQVISVYKNGIIISKKEFKQGKKNGQ